MDLIKPLSFVSLAIAVILYLASVTGIFYGAATPPGDIGLVSTTLVFLLLGAAGLALDRVRAAAD